MNKSNSQYNEIVVLAYEVEKELKTKFKENPKGELLAWLLIAIEREALVSNLYLDNSVFEKVDSLNLDDASKNFVQKAIKYAGIQENVHVVLTKYVLHLLDPPQKLSTSIHRYRKYLFGKMQSREIKNALSRNVIKNFEAKIALVMGRFIQNIPEFLLSLESKDFETYCRINSVMEETAINAYARMKVLIDAIIKKEDIKYTALKPDIQKIYLDENYHYHLFDFLSNLEPKNPINPSTGPLASLTNAKELGISFTHIQNKVYDEELIKKKVTEIQDSVYDTQEMFQMNLIEGMEELKVDPLILSLKQSYQEMASIEIEEFGTLEMGAGAFPTDEY